MKLTQLAAAMALTSASSTALAATYSVTPLPVTDKSLYNFAQSIDESGTMLTATRSHYNIPIDVDFLVESGFVDEFAAGFENEENVRQGVFSTADYNVIITELRTLSNANRPTYLYQHIGEYNTYLTDTVEEEYVPGLDEVADYAGVYALATDTLGRDSLNGDYIVGSTEGAYYRVDYEEDGEVTPLVLNDIEEAAFVQVNNVTKLLTPEDDTLGGLSQAFAINNNLQVVGNGTVDVADAIDTAIASCEDPETRGDVPEVVCKANIRALPDFRFDMPAVGNTRIPGAHVRATVWQLDASGDVLSTTTYPLVFEPDADDKSAYWSLARDINDAGVAVGASSIDKNRNIRRPGGNTFNYEYTNVAVSYADGETTEMLPREDNLQSEAVAINNNNWVTGYVLRSPNGTARNRLFVHNLDTGETEYPQGFFTNSGTQGKAINNNNIVVGLSEFDYSVDVNRETHGFMYDITTGEMTDLNDLLPCDSDYVILDALDINDNNEIIANARLRGAVRYPNGEEVIDSEGAVTESDIFVAVKLSPVTNGSIERCDATDGEEDTGYERQGAAISPWWMLLSSGLLAFRRRRKTQ